MFNDIYCLVVSNMLYFPQYIYIWDNPSHWRTHIFQDCYRITNQFTVAVRHHVASPSVPRPGGLRFLSHGATLRLLAGDLPGPGKGGDGKLPAPAGMGWSFSGWAGFRKCRFFHGDCVWKMKDFSMGISGFRGFHGISMDLWFRFFFRIWMVIQFVIYCWDVRSRVIFHAGFEPWPAGSESPLSVQETLGMRLDRYCVC